MVRVGPHRPLLAQGRDSKLFDAVVRKAGLTGGVYAGITGGSATCSTTEGRCVDRAGLSRHDKAADKLLAVMERQNESEKTGRSRHARALPREDAVVTLCRE